MGLQPEKRRKKVRRGKKRKKKNIPDDELAVEIESDDVTQNPSVASENSERSNIEENDTTKRKKKRKRGEKDSESKSSRYILFIGNLPYDVTKDEVEDHFRGLGDDVVDVRIIKDRGFAFLEVSNSTVFSQALTYHASAIRERPIRVQLTAGGGGRGVTRKRKIQDKNEKLKRQRMKNKKIKDKEHEKRFKAVGV